MTRWTRTSTTRPSHDSHSKILGIRIRAQNHSIYSVCCLIRAIFVWSWKMVSVSVQYIFISQWMKRSKHGLFVFPPKKTLKWRRHWPLMLQYDVKAKYRLILKSSWAWSFFTQAFALPTKIHACLYLFDKPIKELYYCSFVVSVLFARFHFKVKQKSLKQGFAHYILLNVDFKVRIE